MSKRLIPSPQAFVVPSKTTSKHAESAANYDLAGAKAWVHFSGGFNEAFKNQSFEDFPLIIGIESTSGNSE